MSDAWNHFYLVVTLFAVWTVGLGYIGASKVFFEYDKFKEEE